MENQDSDLLEQITSRLPEVLSLPSSLDEPPMVPGPPPFILFRRCLGSSSQLNDQLLCSKKSKFFEQRQSAVGSSDHLPVHSKMKIMQSPSLGFGLPSSTLEQHRFNVQSSFCIPYQKLNQTNRSFGKTKTENYDSSCPYNYLQQLHDQGFEEQNLCITQNSVAETQPYIEIPSWHQLDPVNKVFNAKGNAFHMAESQLDASLVDSIIGRKQYHNKHDYMDGWNLCSSSPDTFNKKLGPNYISVHDMAGLVCVLAKCQEGCHMLQNILKEGTCEDIHKIFLEISHHIFELMMDPFGNYVIQKLLDVCNENQREIIVHLITQAAGKLIVVSCNEYGTHVVQKLIETTKIPEQYFKIVSSLKPGIVSLMKHSEGSHVALTCLKLLSPKYREFLFYSAVGHSVELAKDCIGCVMLQECISELNGKLKHMFLSQIILKAPDLSQDTYGNFVVQKILEQKIPWATAAALDCLKGYYQALSTHRHASHVVEKCLIYAGDERRVEIIQELITEPQFLQIMMDQFGNYVIQTAYKKCKGTLRAALVVAIRPHLQVLCLNPFGRRVLSKTCLKK